MYKGGEGMHYLGDALIFLSAGIIIGFWLAA